MRIISGTARGRQLASFSGEGIRPTPDRVREALFSILSSRLGAFSGLKILELFAGSGAQSLESLSRGAQSAIAIDSSAQAVKLITENAQRCKLQNKLRIIRQDVFAALPGLTSSGPFDLILLDPPYNRDLITRALEQIDSLHLLSEDGIICAESASNEAIEACGNLEKLDNRRYGSTMIHLFTLREDA